MSWDVTLMKAPDNAVHIDEVPEDYGRLGTVAEVVERLQSTVSDVWFENDDTGFWGGADCDAYGLRIYPHTAARRLDPDAPVASADAVEAVTLSLQPTGDPLHDMGHPVWDLIAAACRALECRAEDDGRFLGPDGRPVATQATRKPWWRLWG